MQDILGIAACSSAVTWLLTAIGKTHPLHAAVVACGCNQHSPTNTVRSLDCCVLPTCCCLPPVLSEAVPACWSESRCRSSSAAATSLLLGSRGSRISGTSENKQDIVHHWQHAVVSTVRNSVLAARIQKSESQTRLRLVNTACHGCGVNKRQLRHKHAITLPRYARAGRPAVRLSALCTGK